MIQRGPIRVRSVTTETYPIISRVVAKSGLTLNTRELRTLGTDYGQLFPGCLSLTIMILPTTINNLNNVKKYTY